MTEESIISEDKKSCGCGCGELIDYLDKKGRPRNYKYHHHRRGKKYPNPNYRGDKHHAWKGGRIITYEGYIKTYKPGHPRADRDCYVFEHILVMEQKISRYITKNEDVHHINGIKTDNRPENIMLLTHGGHSGITNKSRPRPYIKRDRFGRFIKK